MADSERERNEERCRRAAVERFERGEAHRAIWTSLGRSKAWFYKWVGRAHSADDRWFEELSRRPARSPSRTEAESEELVRRVRESLEREGRFCGAQAIRWELEDLKVPQTPSLRTINRILARKGLSSPRPERRTPKGRPYPTLAAVRPNDVHQMDFVGPCHLRGPVRFYSLHGVDLATRRCALETAPQGKSAVVELVWEMWLRLGVPRFLQVDNEMVFYGSPRHPRAMGKLIRLCLLNGVEPVFIPQGEPWRNAVVEKFNDHWRRKFLQREAMDDADELRAKSLAFEGRHNASWRYSALGGRSPLESLRACGPALRFPDAACPPQTPLPKPDRGRYHLVRFIRSNGLLDVFGEKFPLPPETVYEYVKVTIDAANRQLTVRLDDRVVAEMNYAAT